MGFQKYFSVSPRLQFFYTPGLNFRLSDFREEYTTTYEECYSGDDIIRTTDFGKRETIGMSAFVQGGARVFLNPRLSLSGDLMFASVGILRARSLSKFEVIYGPNSQREDQFTEAESFSPTIFGDLVSNARIWLGFHF